MAIKLIVTEPFGDYQKGQEITDTKAIKAVQEGDNAGHVVAVSVPDQQAKSKTTE